jgi:hypothetical protein
LTTIPATDVTGLLRDLSGHTHCVDHLPEPIKSPEEANMVKQAGLAVLVTFTLLTAPTGAPGALAGAHDDPQPPRVGGLDSTQRGEDPLQAPRGETR